MKKLTILLSVLLICITLVGCNDQPNRTVSNGNQSRFIFTGQRFYIDGDVEINVVEDTQTKILYLLPNGNGAGLSPWLDENLQIKKSTDK